MIKANTLEEFLKSSESAGKIVDLLVELFSIVGDDPISFSRRIDIRQEIKILLSELDCETDLST